MTHRGVVSRVRLALGATAGLIVATALLAGPAGAKFLTGINGTAQFTSSDAAERGQWLDQTVDLNAGIVRIDVDWDALATGEPQNPASSSDPAYELASLDAAVAGAADRGLRVMLTFLDAPDYAQAGDDPTEREGVWKPRPEALGRLAEALARRYSGDFEGLPRVRYYDVWNEPNLDYFLAPQYEHGRPVAMTRYREMVNAVARAVHAVDVDNQVVVGSLAPYGDQPGGPRSQPLTFLRRLLCLSGRLERTACPTKTHLDVLGHHPINLSGPPRQSAINPNDASSADLDRVRRVLRAAEREHTIAGEKRRHPLWATEFWWTSSLNSFDDFTPRLRKSARYVEESMYLFWKAGAKAAIYYPLVDGSDFRAGLFFEGGSPKPAAQAFAFPFVTERRRGIVRAWGKAPQTGRLHVQREGAQGWTTIKSLHVRSGHVFRSALPVSGPARLRARVGGERSFVWKQR